jgi:hypothetical protein
VPPQRHLADDVDGAGLRVVAAERKISPRRNVSAAADILARTSTKPTATLTIRRE